MKTWVCKKEILTERFARAKKTNDGKPIVYLKCTSVSRSGMSARFDCYLLCYEKRTDTIDKIELLAIATDYVVMGCGLNRYAECASQLYEIAHPQDKSRAYDKVCYKQF